MYTKPDDFILSDDMISSDESYSAFFRDAILQFGIGFCFLVIIVQSVCFKDKGNFQSNLYVPGILGFFNPANKT